MLSNVRRRIFRKAALALIVEVIFSRESLTIILCFHVITIRQKIEIRKMCTISNNHKNINRINVIAIKLYEWQ